jgi:hypothetical protein
MYLQKILLSVLMMRQENFWKRINPLTFPGLKTAVSSEESMQINFISHPKVIISASGCAMREDSTSFKT